MIGLIIVVIGYLMASTGFVGGDLIYAMDVLENWYWIILVILGLITTFLGLIVMVAGTAIGKDVAGKLGSMGGTAVGFLLVGLIAFLMLVKISIQLWLVTWLMTSIDPHAMTFGELADKQLIALAVLLGLALIPTGASTAYKKSKK